MSKNRSVVIIFGFCLMLVSQTMSASDSFEEDEEDEEFERPPPRPARNKPSKPLPETLRGNAQQNIDAKRLNCPLCDASVYSYCSDKLLHDACCCLSPADTDDLPPQCNYADCSFLHANTCREHRLITACCCNQRL